MRLTQAHRDVFTDYAGGKYAHLLDVDLADTTFGFTDPAINILLDCLKDHDCSALAAASFVLDQISLELDSRSPNQGPCNDKDSHQPPANQFEIVGHRHDRVS